MDFENSKVVLGALKRFLDSSTILNTWSLSLLGGSIAVIVGTSFLRPEKVNNRLIYLLFLPAWYFTYLSLFNGNRISRRYVAAVVGQDHPHRLREIVIDINYDFSQQLDNLNYSLVCYASWLLLFLFWWIFSHNKQSNVS